MSKRSKKKAAKKKRTGRSRQVDEQFLSVPTVAQMKGVTRACVMVACAAGRIQRVQKPARDWIIPISAAKEWNPRIRKDSRGVPTEDPS